MPISRKLTFTRPIPTTVKRFGVFSPSGNAKGQGFPVTAKYSVTNTRGQGLAAPRARLREKIMRHRRDRKSVV